MPMIAFQNKTGTKKERRLNLKILGKRVKQNIKEQIKKRKRNEVVDEVEMGSSIFEVARKSACEDRWSVAAMEDVTLQLVAAAANVLVARRCGPCSRPAGPERANSAGASVIAVSDVSSGHVLVAKDDRSSLKGNQETTLDTLRTDSELSAPAGTAESFNGEPQGLGETDSNSNRDHLMLGQNRSTMQNKSSEIRQGQGQTYSEIGFAQRYGGKELKNINMESANATDDAGKAENEDSVESLFGVRVDLCKNHKVRAGDIETDANGRVEVVVETVLQDRLKPEVLLERWHILVLAADPRQFKGKAHESLESSLTHVSGGSGIQRRSGADSQLQRRCAVMLRSIISLAACLPTSRLAKTPGVLNRVHVAGRSDKQLQGLKPSLERAEMSLPILSVGNSTVELCVNYLADLSTAGLSVPLLVEIPAEMPPLSPLEQASRQLQSSDLPLSQPHSLANDRQYEASRFANQDRELQEAALSTKHVSSPRAIPNARRANDSASARTLAQDSPTSSPVGRLGIIQVRRPSTAGSSPTSYIHNNLQQGRSKSLQNRRVTLLPFRRTVVTQSYTGTSPLNFDGSRSGQGVSGASGEVMFYAYSGSSGSSVGEGGNAPHSLPPRLSHVNFPSGRKYPSLSGAEMESMSASLQSSQQLLRSLSSLDRSMREISDGLNSQGHGALDQAKSQHQLGTLSSSMSPPAIPSTSLPEPRSSLLMEPFKPLGLSRRKSMGPGSQATTANNSGLGKAPTNTQGSPRRMPDELLLASMHPQQSDSQRKSTSRPMLNLLTLEMPWHLPENEIDPLAARFMSEYGEQLLLQSPQPSSNSGLDGSAGDLPFAMQDTSFTTDSGDIYGAKEGAHQDMGCRAEEDRSMLEFRKLCQLSCSGLGFIPGSGGMSGSCSMEDTEHEFLRLTTRA